MQGLLLPLPVTSSTHKSLDWTQEGWGQEQNSLAVAQRSLGMTLNDLMFPPCLRLPKVPLPSNTSEIARRILPQIALVRGRSLERGKVM